MEIGKQSIRLEKPVYVESWASVVGKKEGEGPLAPFFDEIETDDQLGQDNWEEAESMLQQKAAGNQKSRMLPGRYTNHLRGGSAGTVHRFFLRDRRTGASNVWSIRGVFHDG